MKKNKVIFYLINILIIITVSLLTAYKIVEENGKETLLHLKEISLVAILVLSFMFIINYFLEGVIMTIAIKESEKQFSPSKGFVVQCVGGLFSAITPLKSGYLPGVAYAYSKYNVKGESIIKCMAKTSFVYQLVCFLISIIAVIVFSINNIFVYVGDSELSLLTVSIIGLIYNIVLMAGYFILVFFPPLHNLIIKAFAYILYKLKKIDNKAQYVKEKMARMKITREQIKLFFKDVKSFVYLTVVYVFKIAFFSGLPYIAYLFLTKDSFNLGEYLFSLLLTNLISYITNIIPIPGASGAAEVAFMGVFSVLFHSGTLASVMFVWRTFSYFINIIVGFFVFVIIINYKKKDYSKSIE